VLPSQAQPSDNCFVTSTYTFNGGIWDLGIQTPSGDVFDARDNRFISMAGINYPTAPTDWQQLSLLNGIPYDTCNTGPAYYTSGNVVTPAVLRRAGSPSCVDDEVTARGQQDLVGGEQLESRAGSLRHEQAVERVVPDQLRKVPDCLGVLSGDA